MMESGILKRFRLIKEGKLDELWPGEESTTIEIPAHMTESEGRALLNIISEMIRKRIG